MNTHTSYFLRTDNFPDSVLIPALKTRQAGNANCPYSNNLAFYWNE